VPVYYPSCYFAVALITFTLTIIKEQPVNDRQQGIDHMKKLLLPLGIFCCLSLPVAADEVVIPVGQQAAEKQSIERPRNGITKDQVQQQFGDPLEWKDPVGEPPISSWEYQGFVVYFEYDRVLHSVLKRNGSDDKGSDDK
jgi:hypothetical protein